MKKWRNKITGEINEFMVHKKIKDSEDGNPVYAPFDGCIDEWEDYEETKGIKDIFVSAKWGERAVIEFETKEKAEKAVEKLKAWKRLKDKGFRFTGRTIGVTKSSGELFFELDNTAEIFEFDSIAKDIDLLLDGEE